MYKMYIFVVFLVLTFDFTAALGCSLSAINKSPTVAVESSTELLVSWEHVFENCDKGDVEKVKVVTAEGEQDVIHYSFDQHKATIATSPCVKHIGIQVELIFTEDYKSQTLESELRSEETAYNNEDPDINKYPYQGLLQREVLSELCQAEDGTIKTPDVPRILEKCKVYTIHKLTGEHSGTVTTTFMDPEDTSQLKIKKILVSTFKKCPTSTPGPPSLSLVVLCILLALVCTALLLVLVTSWLAMRNGKIVWKKKDTGTDMYTPFLALALDEQ